jgi:hypothetical protein
MIYAQLLCVQIQKAQKHNDDLTIILALLGSVHVKAACKTLLKFTPGVWQHQPF